MTEQLKVPASSGGLVRYFDEYKSRIQIKPEFVVLFIILTILFEVIIRMLIKIPH